MAEGRDFGSKLTSITCKDAARQRGIHLPLSIDNSMLSYIHLAERRPPHIIYSDQTSAFAKLLPNAYLSCMPWAKSSISGLSKATLQHPIHRRLDRLNRGCRYSYTSKLHAC